MISKYKNQTITNIGFIGALLIVLLHVKPIPSTAWEIFLVDFVYNKSEFPGIAVPLFFGISGYLLAGHVNEGGWWKTSVKKRLKTLIVPFYAWTFILLLIKLVLLGVTYIFQVQAVTPNPISNGVGWFLLELFGLDILHLTGIVWYLRSLFFMVLISPVFVYVLKKGKTTTILLLLLLAIVHRYGPYSPFDNYWIDAFLANGLYCEGLLPFSIGIALRMYPAVGDKLSMNMCKLGGVIWLVFLFSRYFYDHTMIKYFIQILNVIIIYGFAKFISFPSWIDGLSIRIYLSHMIFKWIIALFFNIAGLYTIYNSVYFWPINYIFIITATMFFITKIRIGTSKVESILFGGR